MEYVFTMVSGDTHIIETMEIENIMENRWVRLNGGEYINMNNVELIRKKEDWE